MGPAPPGDLTVSWQSAFWVLVPCVINTMTQPSGRTCGLPEQYRTYLRSSPIFCAIDALALITRLLIYLARGQPLHRVLLLVRRARFDSGRIACLDGGFQSLEKLTWVRWLIFSLGTLPQIIKLLALQGVPWTKAWGAMFFVSFLVLELFSLAWHLVESNPQTPFLDSVRKAFTSGLHTLSKILLRVFTDTDNPLQPGEVESDSQSDQPQASQRPTEPPVDDIPETLVDTYLDDLGFLDRTLAILAFLFQWILLIWAYDQVTRPVFNLTYLANKPAWLISMYHPGYLLLSTLWAYALYVFAIGLLIIFCNILYGIFWIILRPLSPLHARLTAFIPDRDFAGVIIDTILSKLPVSSRDDGIISLYNPSTWWQIRNRNGQSNSVFALTFSRNDQLLVSAPGDNKVIIWDPITRKQLRKLEGCGSSVTGIAFSCNARLLAGSVDNTVTLWNLVTGEKIQRFGCYSGLVTAVALSHDSQLLAWASDRGTVTLRNPATGDQVQNIQSHTGSVTAMAFSCDSHLLALALADWTIRLWNLATGEQVQKFDGHGGSITAVVFSYSGRLLASASDDKTVILWNTETGQQGRKLEGYRRSVLAVAFSRDGQKLASASDGTIKLWNPVTGEPARAAGSIGSSTILVGFLIFLPGNILLTMGGTFYRGDTKYGLFWELVVLYYFMRLFIGLTWHAIEKQPLRRKLCLLDGQRGSGQRERRKDQIAVASFLTFILSAIVCVLWYQFRYDSTRTYKPPWTDMLG